MTSPIVRIIGSPEWMKAKEEPMTSDCCNAEMTTLFGNEGTNNWMCSFCKKICDPKREKPEFLSECCKKPVWEMKQWDSATSQITDGFLDFYSYPVCSRCGDPCNILMHSDMSKEDLWNECFRRRAQR